MDINEVLDPAAIERAAAAVIAMVTTYGLRMIGAVLLLVVGWIAASWISHAIWRNLGKFKRVDDMLRGFVASLVKYGILAVTLIAVLGQFGVQTTSFVAVIGAAGLAIGLALQGTLSNLAGGVMLLLFRPFKVGDFVDASGQMGTVKHLTLFFTELANPEGVLLIVPNAEIWGKRITNFSVNPVRRFDIPVGISYSDDIDGAIAVLKDVLAAEPRVLADPAPDVFVESLADNSVNLVARCWAKSSEWWPLKSHLIKTIKVAFDAAGISIPFPQRDMHLRVDAGTLRAVLQNPAEPPSQAR
ncbi:Small-conductance mechanosensitive channel [uncultured Alphaproteobacteria bacterium]|uniref:Small-conductance mechanosensitive channel n=1 Tax=uncultured Alphaproteobacteria bacterium TaxID=91750 RepID=A0A212JHJ0_9PROT|nr:Small-conductance mechanosensitive channel [uncultured Alphaproteobacteria bacterium]